MGENRRKFIRQAAATALTAAATATPAAAQKKSAAQKTSARRTRKRKVQTREAPMPVGPYSQAIIAGNTVYVAGQVPVDPKTGKAITGTFEEQATRVFENIKAILKAAGATLDDVVRVNVYLSDLRDFQKLNEVYRRYFSGDLPARTTVGVQLASTYLIEADCIAVL